MNLDLALKRADTLQRPGVPAMPPPPAPDASTAQYDFILTLQETVRLLDSPQLFFQMNPAFICLQGAVNKALQELIAAGIIAPIGKPVQRKSGCAGCARRKLYAFALQFAERFQSVIMMTVDKPEEFAKLSANLKQYLATSHPDRYKPGTPVLLYARLKDNSIRKIQL